jgi:hypothetical protein
MRRSSAIPLSKRPSMTCYRVLISTSVCYVGGQTGHLDSPSWPPNVRCMNTSHAPNRLRRQHYPQRVRGFLLAAQGHRCGICLGPLALLDAHLDHIIPLASGGADVQSNAQMVHPHCNLRKGRKTTFASITGQVPMPGRDRIAVWVAPQWRAPVRLTGRATRRGGPCGRRSSVTRIRPARARLPLGRSSAPACPPHAPPLPPGPRRRW